MKRFFLIVRLAIEAVLGFLFVLDVFFLPQIWKHRDHVALALGELFGAVLCILIGILCFKDVVKIGQILMGSRPSSSLR